MLFVIVLNRRYYGMALTDLTVEITYMTKGAVKKLSALMFSFVILIIKGRNIHNVDMNFTFWERRLIGKVTSKKSLLIITVFSLKNKSLRIKGITVCFVVSSLQLIGKRNIKSVVLWHYFFRFVNGDFVKHSN